MFFKCTAIEPLTAVGKGVLQVVTWSSYSAKGQFFFLRDFIFKKTLFEKLQYLKQEQ